MFLWDQLFESSDAQLFSVGDSVEAIAFDFVNYRVVTTSHQGKIKMLRLEKEGKENTVFPILKTSQAEVIFRIVTAVDCRTN